LAFIIALLQSITVLFGVTSAAYGIVLNSPYPKGENTQKIYYTSFSEPPKTLDPALSYTVPEAVFTGPIYEPILQYDYLTRPYKLVPLTAETLPSIRCDKQNNTTTRCIYTIHIKQGILYQPHPAFGASVKRELVADDYVYEIKRLASPRVNSPIYGLMGEHIEGFLEYARSLPNKQVHPGFLNLRDYPLRGVRVLDKYTYEITLIDQYPQFIYWLAMAFFAPIPWEVDQYYSAPERIKKNITLSWYPVGTGAFMMLENNPNSRIVLVKNPNFHQEYYPSNGSEEDTHRGYQKHAGEKLPLVDRVEFMLEKESIPRWNKFLQGYYDLSGVADNNFDQTLTVSPDGELLLTPIMQEKGISLKEIAEPALFYLGFNMLDSVVGGESNRARLLRRAISIAVNYEEQISIFYNGRGEAAQGPIPLGIFGYQDGKEGMNPYIYRWKKGARVRRSLQEARVLMTEAGYKDGIDPVTHRPLMLNYDVPATGVPDEKSSLSWMVKQFAKIGIQLNIRATQFNRFQEKVRTGNAQIFFGGWNADYPDPENFLFLLYGPNARVQFGGENLSNYRNASYDALFEDMKNRANDAGRQVVIDKMLNIIRYDAPWIFGMSVKLPVLRQQWVSATKPSSVSQNLLKFVSVDVGLRKQKIKEWNQAILWPIVLIVSCIVLLILCFVFLYGRGLRAPVKRIQ
jgi:oligopeptide transport system substrate-binding protein